MTDLPPCPKCSSPYAYEDGALLVCPECAHEWNPDAPAADERVWRDSVGNVLADGDTVTVIKDLKVKGWTTDAALDSAKAAGDEARARLNRAERSVELTKNSLSYATLVADTRGVVTATMIEPGQVVAAGQASIRVARLGEKEAVVAIPETLLARARSGVATVTLWSDAKKTYAARLREVAPQADPATRTYLAKFSLPDADEAVSLGMTATLTLADKASERVAKLPLSALYSQGGDPSLYIVDDKGEVALKPVKVKAYESNNVVISGGVDDGAKVVALGVQKLDPSQKVRVVSSLSF